MYDDPAEAQECFYDYIVENYYQPKRYTFGKAKKTRKEVDISFLAATLRTIKRGERKICLQNN
jgi:hypothetical protein